MLKPRYIVGLVLLIPVLLHLGWATYASPLTNYYLTVDQYVARSTNTPVRIGGQVLPGSIRWDNATGTLRFVLSGEKAQVNVVYRGIPPASFRDGFTAILEGTRGTDGSFRATTILIKCPHQYLPAG